MNFEPDDERDKDLWRTLYESEMDFFKARRDFYVNCKDRIGIIRRALSSPKERGTALRLLPSFDMSERKELFDDLLRIADVGHADIQLCRDVILSLPREWVIANIEKKVEPILEKATYEEYRRFLELYDGLDKDLTHRLALRASQNSDPDIREAGEDFL